MSYKTQSDQRLDGQTISAGPGTNRPRRRASTIGGTLDLGVQPKVKGTNFYQRMRIHATDGV
ncbi:hypothetical protein EYF80_058597 [Liparis tanakae]|uniref:Uncharacterized protein n=1 Tax=Liparis tanakae TaxID=230148 RepID=A0A4Z2ER32_9TELE|nr:hypothetical protein EYF80_058597 [Liparis tanakae]